MPSAETLDAITVDAFGTLLRLEDPTAALGRALAAHGVEREDDVVRAAFRAEAAYYRPRSLRGRDDPSLAELRRECVAVFLAHLDAPLDAAPFAPDFVGALVFHLAEGALEAVEALSAAGLGLGCVANWDVSLHEHLERLGVASRFTAVVTSAEAGVEKPDAGIFEVALARLHVGAARALHVGDEEVDRTGAAAAGLHFEPAPLATLPERIGL